jgi:hypothetical protein
VISFGLGELFWECAQLPIASESLPYGLGVHSKQMEIVPKSMLDTSDRSNLEHVWWNIVIDYTNRKLTFPDKDKLVALSAVATQMSRIMEEFAIHTKLDKRRITGSKNHGDCKDPQISELELGFDGWNLEL